MMPQHCSCVAKLMGGRQARCCGQLQLWGANAVLRSCRGVCLHEELVKVKAIHELPLVVGALRCSSSIHVWNFQLRMLW